MAKVQGIRLVNIKEILGNEGQGFTADIKMGNKTIGTVSDVADGSGILDYFIQAEHKLNFQVAVQKFHKHEMAIEGSLYSHLQSFYVSTEQTFFEFLYLMVDIEKGAKAQFKNGRKYIYIVNYPMLKKDGQIMGTEYDNYASVYAMGFSEDNEWLIDRNLKNFDKPFTHAIKAKSTKDFIFEH